MSEPTDREQIADLVHCYSDAVVHRARDQWVSCWAEDSLWDLGPDRVIVGRGAIADHWQESMDRIECVAQMVSNGTATTNDMTGEGRWYLTEHLRRRNGELGMLLAFYDDTYVRHEGRWLFASRRLRPIYQGTPDLSGPFLPPPPPA